MERPYYFPPILQGRYSSQTRLWGWVFRLAVTLPLWPMRPMRLMRPVRLKLSSPVEGAGQSWKPGGWGRKRLPTPEQCPTWPQSWVESPSLAQGRKLWSSPSWPGALSLMRKTELPPQALSSGLGATRDGLSQPWGTWEVGGRGGEGDPCCHDPGLVPGCPPSYPGWPIPPDTRPAHLYSSPARRYLPHLSPSL